MKYPRRIHPTYCSELTVVCVDEFEVDLGDVELCGAALAQPLHGDVLAGKWSVTPVTFFNCYHHDSRDTWWQVLSIEQTGNF